MNEKKKYSLYMSLMILAPFIYIAIVVYTAEALKGGAILLSSLVTLGYMGLVLFLWNPHPEDYHKTEDA